MLQQCCHKIAATLSQCCSNVVTTSQCCHNIAAMLSQCCSNVVTTLQQCCKCVVAENPAENVVATFLQHFATKNILLQHCKQNVVAESLKMFTLLNQIIDIYQLLSYFSIPLYTSAKVSRGPLYFSITLEVFNDILKQFICYFSKAFYTSVNVSQVQLV